MNEMRVSPDGSNSADVSSAVPSLGTQLDYKKNGEGDEKFAAVANFTDISSFTGSANLVDVTRLNSKGREKRRGMPDWGQVTVALHINMTERSHQDLFNARKDGTLLNFRLTLPDEKNDSKDKVRTSIHFNAYVKDFPISAKVDQMLSSSVNLEVTGDIEINFRK
ncbi:phage tail tube protein [Caballeronia sp. LZ001]|uniref:phage tail tube protein n=1 Tax=Caballeronia sp. LZ001 TaxID=3038553 RepID=UPI002867517F|nr:phage tail tube protein [Caballeronia sp. LZ001]MDR5802564.1 phage tail tube protein [Caballeronia sp. LZ001]